MVLSSASESEPGSDGEQANRIESRFFADSGKRKRAASPPPIEWASMGLKGISPLDGTKRSSKASPVPVAATSTTSSSSFVSALELLRKSGSPPNSDSSDLEPLQPLKSVRASSTVPKPRRQIPTVKAKRAASASSSEAMSMTIPDTKAPEEARPSKRRSISPLSSSDAEDTQPLPAPDLWAKRFSRGSSSAAAAAAPSPSDAKPNVTTTSTTQARAKPWEALEAKIGKVKKPSTRAGSRQPSVGARARSSSLVPAAKKEEEDDHSSDSDVIVTSSLPARARSSSSVRPRSTRPRTPLDFLPPPVELPPEEVVRVLTLCALCSATWPASKTLAAKQGHLRSCATKNEYTAETVRYLVEKQVLELADAAEQERRAVDDGKTLFDRAVGKGEGAHAMRDVTVVGVEGLESAAGKEWFKATTEVQAEIDQARRRVQVAKVIKVAKQIRLDQRARARARDAKEPADDDDDGSAEAALVLPESAGRLQPAAATLVTARADAVLARLDSDDGHSFSETLPSTQEFEQSRLGAGSASTFITARSSTPPPPPPPRASGASSRCETASEMLQSRSPFRQLSLPDPRSGSISRQGHPPQQQHRLEREREIESCSLWQLAAGRDDARLGTVVLKKPSHLTSVSVSPRRRLADPAEQHQQRQSSFQSDHGRDENAWFAKP
ncbi:hypothetical protein C6P46_000350 [Rhodotorula mucilaginosa]|uniref:Uncharacterized protein n=1 Tax=Rhodotorula mucilaginosa TaxID=5537 RepID=A0A9P6VX00_RHOMI|nr:hypothetical protein C6P46_000350 [Rhodotorula mucilaginosa]